MSPPFVSSFRLQWSDMGHGVLRHRQLDCLFNTFELNIKNKLKLRISGPQWAKSAGDWWIYQSEHVALAQIHYGDVIMGAIASQITSILIVYSTVYSDADQRNHQSSASLAFVRGIHWGPMNSPQKWPATRKMFPFDDVIMSGFSYDQHQYLTMVNLT